MVGGRKWWASGAMDPRCAVAIFMGKSSPQAAMHKQQSMLLIPFDSPGVRVIRPMSVYGYDDAPHGHAEVEFQVGCLCFACDLMRPSQPWRGLLHAKPGLLPQVRCGH